MTNTTSMTSMIAALRTQLSAKELANAVNTPSAELVRRWGRGEAQPNNKYREQIIRLYDLYTKEFGG
mgnify:CR=1 FL=1